MSGQDSIEKRSDSSIADGQARDVGDKSAATRGGVGAHELVDKKLLFKMDCL